MSRIPPLSKLRAGAGLEYTATAVRWVIRLSALALLYAAHVSLSSYVADDAYIHFRIARHLAEAGLPYFNLGEPAMGSSSPLWTWLLAAVVGFGASLPHAVALIAAVSVVVAVELALDLARRALGENGEWTSGHAALTVLVAACPLLATSFQGMETTLALALWLAGLGLLDARPPLALLALVAAAGLRLELGITLAAALLYALLRAPSPRARRASLAVVALAGCAVAGYLLWFFGTLIPDTAVAKGVVYQLSTADFLRVLREETLVAALQEIPGSAAALAALALLALALAARALAGRLRRAPGAVVALMLLTGSAVFLAYLVERVLLFPWYVPLFAFPLLLGLWLTALLARSGALQVAAVVLLLPSLLVAGRNLRGAAGDPSWYWDFARSARARQFVEIGRVLQESCPDCSLAAAEIGGLGETFAGDITDGVGLVSPSVLAFHPLAVPEERIAANVGGIPPRLIAARPPDAIVAVELFVEGLLRHPIAHEYEQLVVDTHRPDDRARLGDDFVLWEARGTFVLVHRRLPEERRRALAARLGARRP